MSKSILVIDTPKECNECPLCHSEESVCQATWEYNGWMADIKEICPLKPMPDYKLNTIQNGAYARGWDDCIDEILGEQNEKNKQKNI